jgi:threonine synthase
MAAQPQPGKIRYRSTRGGASDLTFEQAVFEGLAPDGGLMIPHEIPDVSKSYTDWRSLKFDELAYEIASLYCGEDEIPAADLRKLMSRSYATFEHADVVPTVKHGDLHIMELFHGPTFAFKDVALQALGNLYEYFLKRTSRRLTVLGATSGDTGGAAIYGMRGKENVECFILFPEGRVSQIQQQQMTSVLDSNVHCIAVQGTFDDCQNIVKGLFGELDFKKAYGLGAVNSINWARIMFQITYYFYTYFRLFPDCDGTISFSVPTGNFGDILAGYYAKRMGLPVKHLVIATNANDILHRFFESGTYEKYAVVPTNTPSMDIGISSNFERYLYYLMGEDPTKLAAAMKSFNQTGKLQVEKQELFQARQDFASGCAQEKAVMEAIKVYDDKFSYVLDPHTACGVSACEQLRGSLSWASLEKHEMVVLGTAHPGKFGDAVSQATGRATVLPPGLARVQNAPTRFEVLPNSQDDVRNAIVSVVSQRESRRAACQCWLGAMRALLGRPGK